MSRKTLAMVCGLCLAAAGLTACGSEEEVEDASRAATEAQEMGRVNLPLTLKGSFNYQKWYEVRLNFNDVLGKTGVLKVEASRKAGSTSQGRFCANLWCTNLTVGSSDLIQSRFTGRNQSGTFVGQTELVFDIKLAKSVAEELGIQNLVTPTPAQMIKLSQLSAEYDFCDLGVFDDTGDFKWVGDHDVLSPADTTYTMNLSLKD
jgi:hypothetical protein